ncbi:hypothetical protein THMIRHAM_17120 [Thiomicrorhabdus immobilis]|uniref:N-acetyltransferase domain-containing protein n=1 Tax=Thiomicrorhabdus immobilis TaxID=2791037 RepID=A0ABM7MER8_9GAMM|nr:GNAT family N-acetyltransferase [Thiomicrorhabdus immobilis]BCN93927.1 hypothetical protein THMIRHAM_17120 [Thiomicrorhabdus immobilis]
MPNALTFEVASSEAFYEIKHFLKRNQTHSANRGDKIYIVRNHLKLIGVARLLPVEDSPTTFWLRGLFVESAWRKQGIASQLLEHIANQEKSNREIKMIAAFAEPHLLKFYQRNHYTETAITNLPDSLKQRIEQAQSQGKTWRCLQITL